MKTNFKARIIMPVTDFTQYTTRLQILEEVGSGSDPLHGEYTDVLINGAGKEDGTPYRLSKDAMGRTISATDFNEEVELTSTEIAQVLAKAVASNIAFYARFFKSYKDSAAAASFLETVKDMEDHEVLKFSRDPKSVKSFFKSNTNFGELREGVFASPNNEMKEVGRQRLREERFNAMKTLWDDPTRWAVIEEEGKYAIYVKHARGRKAMVHPHTYADEATANAVKDAVKSWISSVELKDASTDDPRRFSILSSNGSESVVALETYVYPNTKAVTKEANSLQGRVTVADLSKPYHQNATQIVTSNIIEMIWNGRRYVNKSLIKLV